MPLMLRRRILVSLTAFLIVIGVGCRAPEASARGSGGAAAITVDLPDDPVVGEAPLTVRIERDGRALRDARVEITGDRTHAGMAPVVVTAEPADDGSYRADDFAFTMAGDWILTVEVELDDGERMRSEVATTVRRP